MADVEHQIVDFLLKEKSDILTRALSRQASDTLADVQRRLQLTVRSLQMPLQDLDERVRKFEKSLTEIEEQRIVLMERIGKEEARLAELVKRRVDPLLGKARRHLETVVRACQDQQGADWSEDATRKAIAAAIPGFFEHEFGEAQELCEGDLRESLMPYRRRADELIAAVHRLVQELFDIPYTSQPQEIALAKAEKPYFRTHQWRFVSIGSIPDARIDQLLPLRWRHARIRRRIMEQVEYLVTRNVGDLRWSTLENLRRSVEGFRANLDERIRETMETTRRALDLALRRRTENSSAVTPEIRRLESAASGLELIREGFSARRHGSGSDG